MIASRQCFGNRIRVRRPLFPKELAEFRLFKDAFQNTPECSSLHKPVQVSAYGLAVCYIRKIGNNKNRAVRSRADAILDLFRITVCHARHLLCPVYYILFRTKSNKPFSKASPRKDFFIHHGKTKHAIIFPFCPEYPHRRTPHIILRSEYGCINT